MPSTQITNVQWVVVSIQPKDRLGNLSTISQLQATSSDPGVASIAVFGDPANYTFKVTGMSAGTTVISFSTLNAAGDTLTNSLDVTVTAEVAVVIDVLVGQPQDQ